MQWCAAGGRARKLASMMRPIEGLPWCKVRDIAGRSDAMANMCTVLSRSDERGARLLETVRDGQVSPDNAATIAGVGFGALDTSAPLPWDFVQHHYPRAALELAHAVMLRRLAR